MAKIRKKPKKSINKNINKKSFTQSTPNIAEKLDNEMVAFLDTEFLTSQIKGGPPAKLVSVGFVVCGKNFEEVTRFHSYIYAEDKLHDRFQEMTGIERKDLLSAPDYELVMEEVAEQLEAWEVSRIYVWGPDKYVIQRDLKTDQKDREQNPSYNQGYRRNLFGKAGSAKCGDWKSEDHLRTRNRSQPQCAGRCGRSEKYHQTH